MIDSPPLGNRGPALRVGAVVAFALVLFATPAWADDDDAAALSTELDRDVAALSTSDCVSACKALASIRRAADRICALEPGGGRCDAAKAKAADATQRVRAACPDCAEAALAPPQPEAANEASASTPAAAPPAEPPHGGCRSCATSPAPDAGDFTVLAIAIAALIAKRRRRA